MLHIVDLEMCARKHCDIFDLRKNLEKNKFIGSVPALDKIRFESIIDKSKLDGQPELFIPDKNNNTLTIIDSALSVYAI
ncbi:unnamed protein product [Prunus armeniaca]|uniref:Uncharacterized protein n=1 Tax=Prunus armeniaca TaxID=36596 RepID=A0A6J5WYP5_PRUAR|nr:unnamed protein product [Prunus armeniaca]